MLIFSDLHLRDESAELVLDTILPAILHDARERGEKVIACLGDVLHFRYRVPAPLLNGLRDWCLAVTADYIEVVFLPGNHDQYDLSGRNALEPLGSIPGVTVHTQPTLDEHGLWVPYRKDPEQLREALKLADGCDVAFMHHGVKGAWMNDNIQNTEGLSEAEFQAFRIVILGHYHRRHRVGPAANYIGSPYQTKADESGQEKGYSIWDGTRLEPVNKLWGKRYHRITLEPGQVLDTSTFSEGDEVRVKTALGVDPVVVGKQLHQLGVTHTVTPDLAGSELRLEVAADASFTDYAAAYIHRCGGDLDHAQLLQTFSEVTSDG